MISQKAHHFDKSHDQAHVVAELSATLTASLAQDPSFDRMLAATINHLSPLFHITDASLCLIKEDAFVVHALWGQGIDRCVGQKIEKNVDALWRAVETDQVYIQYAPTSVVAEGGQSYLAMPLRWQGQAGGVFEISIQHANTFDEEHLVLLHHVRTVLSNSIGLAEHLHKVHETVAVQERAARRLEAQYTITRILTEAPSFMEVATQIPQTIGEQLRWKLD